MYEFLGASLNIGILAVFYTAVGGLLSYVMGYLFDDFDPVWQKRSIGYQLGEICLELTVFGFVAFWLSNTIKDAAPVFSVSEHMDKAVDSYVSGLFFAYAMFLFMDHLSTKIKHVYEKIVAPHVKKILPSGGYLLDGTLHYESRKTDA